MLATELKETRLSLGLTQKQIADELGITTVAVCSFEHTKTRIRPRTAEKLLNAMAAVARRQAADRRRTQLAELMGTLAD